MLNVHYMLINNYKDAQCPRSYEILEWNHNIRYIYMIMITRSSERIFNPMRYMLSINAYVMRRSFQNNS